MKRVAEALSLGDTSCFVSFSLMVCSKSRHINASIFLFIKGFTHSCEGCPCVLERINWWTWHVLASYLIPISGALAIHSSTKVEYTTVPSGISNYRITFVKGTPNVPYKVFNWFSKASDHLVQSFSSFKAPGPAYTLMVSIWSFCFFVIVARLPASLSA